METAQRLPSMEAKRLENNYHCGQGDDCSDDTGQNPKPAFTGVWYLYIAPRLTAA